MPPAPPTPPGPPAPDSPGRGTPVLDALATVLRPLARLAVRHGVGLGALTPALKRALVEAAAIDPEGDGGGAGRPASQSRISLMTGVHRKDVRDILASGRPQGEPPRPSIAETAMARWLALPTGPDGRPPVLPRRREEDVEGDAARAAAAPGFDALVAGVSRDVRPRAVLDEMIRLGMVALEGGDGPDDPDARLRLVADAHLPAEGQDAERLALFAGNLADHASTAAGNLLAGPGRPRRLEQAVFHTHLAPESVVELEAEARRLSGEALQVLNRRALDLQRRDLARGTATRRFRFGVYFFDAPLDPGAGARHDGDDQPEGAADGGGTGEDGPP